MNELKTSTLKNYDLEKPRSWKDILKRWGLNTGSMQNIQQVHLYFLMRYLIQHHEKTELKLRFYRVGQILAHQNKSIIWMAKQSTHANSFALSPWSWAVNAQYLESPYDVRFCLISCLYRSGKVQTNQPRYK